MPVVAFPGYLALQGNRFDRCQPVNQISAQSIRNVQLRGMGALVSGEDNANATVGQFEALGNY